MLVLRPISYIKRYYWIPNINYYNYKINSLNINEHNISKEFIISLHNYNDNLKECHELLEKQKIELLNINIKLHNINNKFNNILSKVNKNAF
jgi:hypothetical protein